MDTSLAVLQERSGRPRGGFWLALGSIGVALGLIGCFDPAGVEAATPPTGYAVGAGDQLKIDVLGRTDLSGLYNVAEDGTITLPLVGPIPVRGRTAQELSSDLSRRLSFFDRAITRVVVTVAQYRSQKIFVLGAVLIPGVYSFAQLPNAWEAMAEAGGPTQDADLTAVEVIPGDVTGGRTTSIIDVAAAIRDRRLESLEKLKVGDTVRVPRGGTAAGLSGISSGISIFGAILRPGVMPATQAPDLVLAIITSGGPTADANLKGVEIVRRHGTRITRMKVNMAEYFEKATISGNPVLEPGDTIYLPRSRGGRGPFFTTIGGIATLLGVVTSVAIIADRISR